MKRSKFIKGKSSNKNKVVLNKNQNKIKKQKEVIFIFSAHSDDFVIGCGGTIAKYNSEGKEVRCYVFSFGEKSHPWMKADSVKEIREKECQAASELLGCKTTIFDLHEGKFRDDAKEINLIKLLTKEVERFKPSKIFIHSKEDPHPDHKDVYYFCMTVIKRLEQLKEKKLYNEIPNNKLIQTNNKTIVNTKNVIVIPDIYVYSVWNPVEFKTRYPALYIDVKDTFETKMEAMRLFKSQTVHVAFPTFLLLFRAFRDGFYSRHKLAEKFFLVKTDTDES